MSTPGLARLHRWGRSGALDVDIDNHGARLVQVQVQAAQGCVYVQTRGREGALALCTLCVRLTATWRRVGLFGCAVSKGLGRDDDPEVDRTRVSRAPAGHAA